MVLGAGENRGSGQFHPRNAKKKIALENQKEPLKIPINCNGKSLFNVADLVSGMWKVAPPPKKKKKKFFPGDR